MLERLQGLPLYQLRALYRLNLGSISSELDNTRKHELYNLSDVIFDAMQKRLEAIRKKPSLAKTELRDQVEHHFSLSEGSSNRPAHYASYAQTQWQLYCHAMVLT